MNAMDSPLTDSLALCAYVAAWAVLLWTLWRSDGSTVGAKSARLLFLIPALTAVGLHGFSAYASLATENGPNFSFLNALSLVTLCINGVLLGASLFRPVDKLSVITLPIAAAIFTLKAVLPAESHPVQNHSWQMTLHIFSSLLAYSLLNIAALQALLLAIQDWRLRHHQPGGFLTRSLPSLQSMERLMFQLIASGLVLLTLSLLTGFAFMDNMFAQHLAHKTVLSLLAWLVFTVLLLGRQHYGWRGQTAIRWTLSGFVSLMLAYFGSKMVLELILNRA